MEEFGAGSGSLSSSMTADAGNDTLTCAARNIQGPVEVSFNPLVLLVIRCLLAIFFMNIAFFGTLLNGFAFYLICRYKQLRSSSFLFAIQIVGSDIVVSAVIVPLSLSSVLANQWQLGEGMCIFTGGLHVCGTILRVLFLAGLVVDRFCCVFFTYTYPRYQTKVLWCISAVTYLVAAIYTIIGGVFDCFSFSESSFICRVDSTCSPQCAAIRSLTGLTIFLPMGMLPVVLYSALFHKGRKVRNSMRMAANFTASEAHKVKKEWRATITFFLMFLALFLVNVPPGIFSLVINITGITSNSTESLWFYILDALSLNSFILSHVAVPIFILRNKDVREVISEIKWIPFLQVRSVNNVVLGGISARPSS